MQKLNLHVVGLLLLLLFSCKGRGPKEQEEKDTAQVQEALDKTADTTNDATKNASGGFSISLTDKTTDKDKDNYVLVTVNPGGTGIELKDLFVTAYIENNKGKVRGAGDKKGKELAYTLELNDHSLEHIWLYKIGLRKTANLQKGKSISFKIQCTPDSGIQKGDKYTVIVILEHKGNDPYKVTESIELTALKDTTELAKVKKGIEPTVVQDTSGTGTSKSVQREKGALQEKTIKSKKSDTGIANMPPTVPPAIFEPGRYETTATKTEKDAFGASAADVQPIAQPAVSAIEHEPLKEESEADKPAASLPDIQPAAGQAVSEDEHEAVTEQVETAMPEASAADVQPTSQQAVSEDEEDEYESITEESEAGKPAVSLPDIQPAAGQAVSEDEHETFTEQVEPTMPAASAADAQPVTQQAVSETVEPNPNVHQSEKFRLILKNDLEDKRSTKNHHLYVTIEAIYGDIEPADYLVNAYVENGRGTVKAEAQNKKGNGRAYTAELKDDKSLAEILPHRRGGRKKITGANAQKSFLFKILCSPGRNVQPGESYTVVVNITHKGTNLCVRGSETFTKASD